MNLGDWKPVPTHAEAMYRVIAGTTGADGTTGTRTIEDIATLVGVDVATARDEIDALVHLGLVKEQDGEIRALSPRLPLERLAASQVHALDLTHQVSSRLFEIWSQGSVSPSLFEVITDEDEMKALEESLMADATGTVDALCIGPVAPRKRTPAQVIAPPPPQIFAGFFEAVERGVQMRTLYGVTVLEDEIGLAAVQQCIAAGEEARVFPGVPLNLTLFDGRRALASVPGERGARRTLVLIHEFGLIDCLIQLFEVLWQMGAPLGADSEGFDAEDGPDQESRQLLAYLAAGLTDEAIARDLGVSARTLGRRIERLAEILGAHSRFQLALQASRRGWL